MPLTQDNDSQEENFIATDTQTDGTAGVPAKMCSECYTNQTFVYDDGTAHDHTPR